MSSHLVKPIAVGLVWGLGSAGVLHAQRPASTEYRNENYGYRVRLPTNLTIQTTASPWPNHGFGAQLDLSTYLWVDGSFPEAANGLDGAVKEELEHQRDGCVEQQRRNAKHANIPAVEVVLKCEAD